MGLSEPRVQLLNLIFEEPPRRAIVCTTHGWRLLLPTKVR